MYAMYLYTSHIFKLKIVPQWIVRETEGMEKFVMRRVEMRITHFYTSFNSSRREYGNAFLIFSPEELQLEKYSRMIFFARADFQRISCRKMM